MFGGTVFELTPVGGGNWSEHVLHSFSGGTDGAIPSADLLSTAKATCTAQPSLAAALDLASQLRGFRIAEWHLSLSPPSTQGGQWTETLLHSFAGDIDGASPSSKLAPDGQGNFYGTTESGGGLGVCARTANHHCGTVFMLAPPAATGASWTETILHSFSGGSDGRSPEWGVVLDSLGNIYGTTVAGGRTGCRVGCGTVFELATTQNGWVKTILYDFTGGIDGGVPTGNLVTDPTGDLYGVVGAGGQYNHGVVFEITP